MGGGGVSNATPGSPTQPPKDRMRPTIRGRAHLAQRLDMPKGARPIIVEAGRRLRRGRGQKKRGGGSVSGYL